jgi:hypothetical protein
MFDQPLAPLHVRVPAHVPVGVVIEHGTVMPAFDASQSHEPDVGTHCLLAGPMSPALTSVQLNPLGQPILLQSRPQKCPPTGVGKHQSCPPTEHSLFC